MRGSVNGNLLTAASFLALAACNVGPIDPTGAASDTGGAAGSAPAGAPAGATSGVPRTLALSELSSAQESVLCEWTNLRQGGYGRVVSCGGFGSAAGTDATNTDCVTATSLIAYRCPALTVANEEDCVNATGSDLCTIPSSPACAPINACKS